jgi:DNA-binding beta-propeller fold protein YncE
MRGRVRRSRVVMTTGRGTLIDAVRLAVAFTVCSLIATASALATTGHSYSAQFGTAGTAAGQFSAPAGVTVEQSSGDVYVTDQSNNRVEKFDAGGGFLLTFTGEATPAGSFSSPASVAVDPTSGDVYVADAGNNAVDKLSATGAYISQLDASGTPAGAFSYPSGVAIDPSDGDIYVADEFNDVVDVFDKAGSFVTSFDGSSAPDGEPFSYPSSVSVDSDSRVYVLDAGKSQVEEYASHGAAFIRTLPSSSPQAVSVDPGSNDVYVGASNSTGQYQVSEYDPSGTFVYSFGAGRIGSSTGIGVRASDGRVYVADSTNDDVLLFNSFLAPTVTTGGASQVSATGAAIEGTVDPEGVATSYRFEYGTEASYGNSTPEVEAGTGSAAVSASAELEGLLPNTTYHYRLIATNASGPNAGEDRTFTTSTAPPVVNGQQALASAVTATTATLHATIDPENSPTTYHFNYGTTTAYGSQAPEPDAQGGTGLEEEAVSTTITGLQPLTTYHFQIVAENGTGGPTAGVDQTFTTLPPPPLVSTGGVVSVTTTSASLLGTVNTNGLVGTYQFVVTGTDTPAGGATSPASLASSSGAVAVSGTVNGLSPGLQYTYRLAVTTAGGTAYGAPRPLVTPALPAYQAPSGPQAIEGLASSGLVTPAVQLLALTPDTATPGSTTKTVPRPPTRAQSLAKALKGCRARRNKRRRAKCEGQARRRYGTRSRAKKPSRRKR